MLKNRKKGDNISILNTFYMYPKKQQDGKWDDGSITIIYKDNDTNEKYQESIENPSYSYYKLKDEYTLTGNQTFIDEDMVRKITVPYKDLKKSIAKEIDKTKEYYDCLNMGNRREGEKLLFTDPRIFSADQNIEDRYRRDFSRYYLNEPNNHITTAFFDIEVDGIDQQGDFPELGECPINAISYINPIDNTEYTLLLENDKNPQIEEFKREYLSNPDGIEKEIKDFVRETVGGWKSEIRFGLQDRKYKLLFYNDEIELIQNFFILVNYFKPDFLLAWNMRFDIPYIIQRIINLGYDPASIMCHKDFKHKVATYYIDNGLNSKGKPKEAGERGDKATIASYTVYLDQLIQFASIRRGQSKYDNMKLDYIGSVVAGVRKLDYSHITASIRKLPYLNYKVFVFYNIFDPIVQYCIEEKCKDIDYVYNKALFNNTRYSKVHRNVTYLTNTIGEEFYKSSGLIIGNNINAFQERTKEEKGKKKYPGAYVASSTHLNNYSKQKIGDRYVNVFHNVIDEDYSAQYPNEIRENNMAPWTEIGKLYIEDGVLKVENPLGRDHYDRGGQFIEDLTSHIYIEFCERWLHLAGYKDMIHDIDEYLKLSVMNPFYNLYSVINNKLTIMNKYDENMRSVGIPIMRKYNKGEKQIIMNKYYKPTIDFKEVYSKINIEEVVYYDDKRVIGKSIKPCKRG